MQPLLLFQGKMVRAKRYRRGRKRKEEKGRGENIYKFGSL